MTRMKKEIQRDEAIRQYIRETVTSVQNRAHNAIGKLRTEIGDLQARLQQVCPHKHAMFAKQDADFLFFVCPDCGYEKWLHIPELTDSWSNRAVAQGFDVPGGIRHG